MQQTYNLLIKDCTLIDPEFHVLTHRDIAISGGKIAAITVSGEASLAGDAAETLDGRGKLFLPGLGDAHTHTCQQLLRGRILDELPMIWTRIMLPFESGLTEEAVDACARLACLEMIKSGTTAFADAGGRFMHKVAQAAIDAGLRAALTCSTIDSGNAPPDDEVLHRRRAAPQRRLLRGVSRRGRRTHTGLLLNPFDALLFGRTDRQGL